MNQRLIGVGDRVRCVKGPVEGCRGEVVRAYDDALCVVLDDLRVFVLRRDRWELESEDGT